MRIESDSISSSDDDALDRLLAQADWPAADEATIARLRTTLESQSIAASFSGRRWWGVAIAASVIIACGLAVILMRSSPSSPVVVRVESPKSSVIPKRESGITARPANVYEVALLLSNSQALGTVAVQPNTVAKAPSTNVPTLIASLNDPAKRDQAIKTLAKIATPAELVRIASDSKSTGQTQNALCTVLLTRGDSAGINGYLQLVQNPGTRNTALDALRHFDQPPVQALVNELDASLVDRRYAAARAMGCMCHGPTFATLQRLVETDVHRRREAMIALLYCPNPDAKKYLDQLRDRPVLGKVLDAVEVQKKLLDRNI